MISRRFLATALIALTVAPASALPKRVLIPLLTQCPGVVLKAESSCPSVDFNFSAGFAWVNRAGYVPFTSLLSVIRAQTVSSYAQTSTGTLIPFAANSLRITDQGILIEEARANDALWSRDLTNAAWTAVNVTAAKNAIGADGGANAATTLTATASNGTILQSITLASTADTSSVYLECVTCTGAIQITENNGSTWTTCAGLVTTAFTRCSVTATLANPIIGLRIVNSGDIVIADFFQMEPGSFATSPIPTTTVTVTRALDNITATTAALGYASGPFSIIVSAQFSQTALQDSYILDATNGERILMLMAHSASTPHIQYGLQHSSAFSILSNGSGTFTAGSNVAVKDAIAFATSDFQAYLNGAADLSSGSAVIPTPTTFYIGQTSTNAQQLNGYLKRLTTFNSRLPNSSLGSLSK